MACDGYGQRGFTCDDTWAYFFACRGHLVRAGLLPFVMLFLLVAIAAWNCHQLYLLELGQQCGWQIQIAQDINENFRLRSNQSNHTV